MGDHVDDDDEGGVEEEIGGEDVELHAGGLLAAVATGQTRGGREGGREGKEGDGHDEVTY